MRNWVMHPKKSLEEVLEERKKYWEAERSKWIGSAPFSNYPQDKFFTRNNPFFIIPAGYAGVRERFGQIGEILESTPDQNGLETNEQGETVKNYRAIPGGGLVKPGWRFMASWKGAWSRVAVVNTKSRTEEISLSNVITEKGALEIPKVVATLNYKVIDPVKAMTRVDNYQKRATEMAQVRIRDAFAPRTLETLSDLKNEHLNLSPAPGEDGFIQLNNAGLQFEGLYLTDYDLPDELERELAAEVLAREKAQGALAAAKIYEQAAAADQRAALLYHDPVALKVLYVRTASDTGYKPHIGEFADALNNLTEAITGRKKTYP